MSQEARVRELSERHKRLEAAIAAELKHPAGDDLRIHELKRFGRVYFLFSAYSL